ncbi:MULTISPECIES: hypothetical protein [unclassified Pseudomonas]|uniref:hypothetical protein n=1 Tax=unclassified Pseudomonas TaxID=196821 RepID=UPI002B234729|nr:MULTISPECIES: hypothetical protein [unclassified Pseudomonas]MEA9979320.1 hypothetical protein [Pseudomonas sp. RTS4]MEB0197909.1 hypothetical protein [Pseudomonas sp. 5S4]MEB0246405.1 hypothetical protein [Pseudomonas sp. 10S5]
MSLLSGLLDHMPPTIAGTDKSKMASRVTDRPRLVPVERSANLPPRTYNTAAHATPEWRDARDRYLAHILVCRSCYAPTSRHCQPGTDLRALYDGTPMEAPR